MTTRPRRTLCRLSVEEKTETTFPKIVLGDSSNTRDLDFGLVTEMSGERRYPTRILLVRGRTPEVRDKGRVVDVSRPGRTGRPSLCGRSKKTGVGGVRVDLIQGYFIHTKEDSGTFQT